MRNNSNSRRMRPRNNGRNNNGGKRVNPKVQTFDSNGPDVRVRGTAYQISDKYMSLAKDAASAGDRILAESYLQHAEHYQRFIAEMTERFESFKQQQRERALAENGTNSEDDDIEDDVEDNDPDNGVEVIVVVDEEGDNDDVGGSAEVKDASEDVVEPVKKKPVVKRKNPPRKKETELETA